MQSDQFLNFFKEPLFSKLVYVFIAALIIWLGVRLSKRMLSKYVPNNTTRYQARKFITLLSYLLLAIVAMVIFNYKLSSVTLALGLAGAGIAFALQEVIVSIAGFLAILSGNFYKVGDRIQMGGIKGDVVDIGILRTTLMEIGGWVDGDLYNGKMVRVANSFLFKEPVANYSGDFPFLWDEIKIPVKTSGDHEWFRSVLEEILEAEVGQYAAESQASWDKLTQQLYVEKAQVKPMVTMTFDEGKATYTLRYVVDFMFRRGTKDKLFREILRRINEHKKIEIAGSAMDVTLINTN